MSIKQLADMLMTWGVDLNVWGKGEAKAVEDLWNEITHRESVLRVESTPDNSALRLVRVLHVVKVNIVHNLTGFVLLETSQVLPDGRVRTRNLLPGGKVAFGEEPIVALKREMSEELGLESDEYVDPVFLSIVLEEKTSRSYPGFPTVYEKHSFRTSLLSEIEKGRFESGYIHKEESGLVSVFEWVRQ